MSSAAGKQALIVDSQAEIRTQLQKAFQEFGFDNPHAVADIKDALWHLQSVSYDMILCGYDLGTGTDGQQFLEYLRTRDLISRNTIFIMATAERTYEKVVAVAECAPDDYLLRPFTTEQLHVRIEKQLERQAQFVAIDRATDAKDWVSVVAECDRLIENKDKYLTEAYRIKGAALLRIPMPQEAAALYEKVLGVRPLPWARLGLARARAMLGDKRGGIAMARAIVAEHDRYMNAYDFLGEALTEAGDKKGALEILQSARQVSPGTLSRIRHVANLAIDIGRQDVAERVLREALAHHKHSPVIEAQDYASLSRILTEEGRPDKALAVIAQAQAAFEDDASKALLATSECLAHRRAGHPDLAQNALAEALAKNQGQLPPDIATAVAEACLAMGQTERGTSLLKQVVQNNPEDAAAQAKVRVVLAATGSNAQEAAEIVATSVQEIVHLNNEGVRKAEAGALAEAVNMLCDAADRLPNNLQIVSNAALALAMDMQHNGFTSIKMNECLRYRQIVIDKSPGHPKLARIDATLDHVKRS